MSAPTTQDARRSVMQLTFGAMAAQVVGAVTRMRLPDAMGETTHTPAELAGLYRTPEQTMQRLLRAVAALGLCTEEEPGRFTLTEAGSLLRQDVPGSVYSFVRMVTDDAMLLPWSRLESSVRTGRTAFDDVFGAPFFQHLADDPELSELFNASMSQGAAGAAATVPDAYDFSRFQQVTDVGGGDGTLLAAILSKHPALRGTVYDSEAGSARTLEVLARAGVAERATVRTGDFFTEVPGGADLYLLKSIVHDWDDERAATILRHCRAELPEHGRVLIIEPVLPAQVVPGGPPGIYLSDLNMLVNVGGRERTREDFESLCTAAGLVVTEFQALPPQIGFWLIEAKAA